MNTVEAVNQAMQYLGLSDEEQALVRGLLADTKALSTAQDLTVPIPTLLGLVDADENKAIALLDRLMQPRRFPSAPHMLVAGRVLDMYAYGGKPPMLRFRVGRLFLELVDSQRQPEDAGPDEAC